MVTLNQWFRTALDAAHHILFRANAARIPIASMGNRRSKVIVMLQETLKEHHRHQDQIDEVLKLLKDNCYDQQSLIHEGLKRGFPAEESTRKDGVMTFVQIAFKHKAVVAVRLVHMTASKTTHLHVGSLDFRPKAQQPDWQSTETCESMAVAARSNTQISTTASVRPHLPQSLLSNRQNKQARQPKESSS